MQTTRGTAIAEHRVLAPARARALAIGLGVVGFGADLATKTLALNNLDPANPIRLLGGLLNLQLIRNPGAAFSMGESVTWLFTSISIAALIGVSVFLVPRVRHVGWTWATGLLLAGITGNLADRLFREPAPFRGYVVDFLQFPWFICNVADVWITFAAVVIGWLALITKVTPAGVPEADAAPRVS